MKWTNITHHVIKYSCKRFYSKCPRRHSCKYILKYDHAFDSKLDHFNGLEKCFYTGNTKGGSITEPLTSCLTGLDLSVLQIKTKIVNSHTADSKPVKQEVNGTVIPL